MGERPRFRPPFLKEWRKHRDLTQERMAERIGVSVGLVSMIERGDRQYTQAYLEAAAEALETTPDRLLRINPLDPSSDETIFEQIRRIPAEDLPRVSAILDAFATKTEPAPKPAARKKRPA